MSSVTTSDVIVGIGTRAGAFEPPVSSSWSFHAALLPAVKLLLLEYRRWWAEVAAGQLTGLLAMSSWMASVAGSVLKLLELGRVSRKMPSPSAVPAFCVAKVACCSQSLLLNASPERCRNSADVPGLSSNALLLADRRLRPRKLGLKADGA
jgi:hypothetical protein